MLDDTDGSCRGPARSLVLILLAACLAQAASGVTIDNYSAAANDRFANNPAFIAGNFNLSGLSRASNGAWVTMIAPNIFATAWHSSPTEGSTVRFYQTNDPSGPSVVRAVTGLRQRIGKTDILLGTLDAPLPEGYAFYSRAKGAISGKEEWESSFYRQAALYVFGLSPGSYSGDQDIAVGRNIPDRWLGQHKIKDSVTWAFGAQSDSPGAPSCQVHETKTETGDSGAPVFYDAGGGSLRLLGLLWGKGVQPDSSEVAVFTYLGNYQAEILSFLTAHALSLVPNPPSDLKAAKLSPTRADLSWTDNSAIETSFLLERSTDGVKWTHVATLPANTTSYSDTASPPGEVRYRLKAAASNPAGAVYSGALTALAETVTYDIYVLAGQSNAAGYGTNISRLPAPYASLATPNQNVDFLYWYRRDQSAPVYETAKFAPLAARNVSGEPPGEFGLELSLGQALAGVPASRPVIVKVTAGSSGLYQMTNGHMDWNVNTAGEKSLYQALISKVRQAISLVPPGAAARVRGFIWAQGERESDAAAPEWAPEKNRAYQANLQALVNGFKSAFAAYGANDARIVIVQTLQRRGIFEDNPANQEHNARVRAAQKAVALSEPNGRLVAIDDFRQNDGSDTDPFADTNNVHYLTGEVVQLGYRVAEALTAPAGADLTYRGAFVNTSLPPADRALGTQLGPAPRKVAWAATLSPTGADITAASGETLAALVTVPSKENQRGYYSCHGGINVVHNPDTSRCAILLHAPISEALPVVETPFTLDRLQSVTFDYGPWNLNTALRFAVKADGVWYLRAGNLEAAAPVSKGNFSSQASTLTQPVDREAANWRVLPFTPGSAFPSDPDALAPPASDLPATAEVQEVGWFIFSKTQPESVALAHPKGPLAARLQHLAVTYSPPRRQQ